VDRAKYAPSQAYDFDYRAAVIALSFDLHAKVFTPPLRRINTSRLKLLQFVAQRPWLVPVISDWGKFRHDASGSLLVPQRLRRGYLSDPVFEHLVDFLVAEGTFVRTESHLLESADTTRLRDSLELIFRQDIFLRERKALESLKHATITNSMLEGA
jgi:hypothetical protein